MMIEGAVKFYADQEEGWQAARLNLPVTGENSIWTDGRGRAEWRTGPVAVRLDHSNQTALDYYLLPQMDFGQPRISLAEHNGIEFESYRFDSLDFLYGMAERARELGWTLTIDSQPGQGTCVKVMAS